MTESEVSKSSGGLGKVDQDSSLEPEGISLVDFCVQLDECTPTVSNKENSCDALQLETTLQF